jgi:hypothetical protein
MSATSTVAPVAVAEPAIRKTTAPVRSLSAFRKVWPRLLAGLRTVAGWLPLTWLGLLTSVLLVWLLRSYGIARKDMILLALSLGGLALVGCSVLFVVATALWLRLSKRGLRQPKLTLEAGSPCRTGYLLGRITWNPLVNVRLDWESPRGAGVRLVATWEGRAEEVTPAGRGLTGVVVRRFTVTDVLGLARLSFRRREMREVEIRPACGRMPALPLLPQTVAGDDFEDPEGRPVGDLNEMRQYAPGDPLRLVLWKVYARTGELLVRAPERSAARSERTLAYLVAAEADEPAAGIARTTLETGLLGEDFVFAAGDGPLARTAAEAIEQIVRSASARDSAAVGLGSLLEQGSHEGLRACLLFVPGQPGRWLDTVADILASHPGPFRVLIGVDGIAPRRAGGRWRRLLLREAPAAGARADDVWRVYETLAKLAAEVCVLDRLSGEAIQPAALAAAAGARPARA